MVFLFLPGLMETEVASHLSLKEKSIGRIQVFTDATGDALALGHQKAQEQTQFLLLADQSNRARKLYRSTGCRGCSIDKSYSF